MYVSVYEVYKNMNKYIQCFWTIIINVSKLLSDEASMGLSLWDAQHNTYINISGKSQNVDL